ncbi:MAG: hypothetical protein EBT44_06255 [Actinobacteria bacterium]|uniref:Uncharacterized protein n=1 Tax=Candidatus Fonsibacter lacus TaxID=2576439 RepID=A0A965LLN1_9PROT|nr:hypothetical protein [Candidatus Fonsibacter lacus]
MDNFLYLSRIYDGINPEFSENFPDAIDENDYETTLIQGFDKVVRGLRLLNTLYDFEKDGLENLVDTKESSFPSELDSTDSSERKPSIIDSWFAVALSNDARLVAQCFQEFTPDQKCDLYPLFRELVYLKDNYFDSHSYPGHIDVMIQRTIASLAIGDLEIEAQTSALAVLEFQDPPSWNFGPFYEEILRAMTSYDFQAKEKNPVSVKRFFVGYLACIVASDDDAELISKSEFEIPKGEWDDSYKYGQIYRNDKRAPDSREEWFGILAPTSDALYLGERNYKNFEEAIKYEKIWMDLTFDVLR